MIHILLRAGRQAQLRPLGYKAKVMVTIRKED
jgi:hypothetical protein